MGKPKTDNSIEKEYNINRLLEDTEICMEICNISYEDLEDSIKEESIRIQLEEYYSQSYCNKSERIQAGRVWFLIRKQDGHSEVLQVAQAIDLGKQRGFFGEIFTHVEEILNKENNDYGQYAKELGTKDQLLFYELNVEKYLKKYAPLDYRDIICRMACEYFAEASIAHFTQARDWGFYNSGMDKRAYYYLKNNIEVKKIDEQRTYESE